MNRVNTSTWDVPSSFDTPNAKGRRRLATLGAALGLGAISVYSHFPNVKAGVDSTINYTLSRVAKGIQDLKEPIDGPKIPQPHLPALPSNIAMPRKED